MRDWMLLSESEGAHLGFVCPDVFAADATPDRVRFTLLRSAIMAHHEPYRESASRVTISDQGTHTFQFRIFYGSAVNADSLECHGLMLQRPLVMAEVTKGMPSRFRNDPASMARNLQARSALSQLRPGTPSIGHAGT
jgi:hypothetical protein